MRFNQIIPVTVIRVVPGDTVTAPVLPVVSIAAGTVIAVPAGAGSVKTPPA